MERIALALLGTGVAAEYHASAVSLSDAYQMVSLFSRSERHGKEFAYRHGIPKYFNDIEYLYEGSNPDLLVIAGETSRHFSLSLEALMRGLGVIVEAPLTLNLREAKALVEEAEEGGSFLLEANPILSLPAFLKLRETMVSGALGRIKKVSLTMCRPKGESYLSEERWQGRPEKAGGGILMQEGYWGVSALCSLLGKGEVVSSLLEDLTPNGLERSAHLLLSFHGIQTEVELSSLRSGHPFLLVVEGEKGTATVNGEEFFLGETAQKEGDKAFNLYRHIGNEYQRFLRFLQDGEDLTEEFQRILNTYTLLSSILQ